MNKIPTFWNARRQSGTVKSQFSILGVVCLLGMLIVVPATAMDVQVVVDPEAKGLSFAAGDINVALKKRGHTLTSVRPDKMNGVAGMTIVLAPSGDKAAQKAFAAAGGKLPTGLQPEGYAIRSTKTAGTKTWWVWGADLTGTMYGGLDLAETIELDGMSGIAEKLQNRYLPVRGQKINIPLDVRTPAYGDYGDAAQKNIPEMWSMDFWKQHLDMMARYRYNSITLWNNHPFPALVKVPEYPDVALQDVKRTAADYRQWHVDYSRYGDNMINDTLLGNTETVRVMTMDEKIKFWQDVMQYGHDRGITFYLITWNIFISSAQFHYGLTEEPGDEKTIDYMRKSVRSVFQTYPLLGGIGVTAGEHMDGMDAAEKEDWLWNTYGEGLMDAKRADKTEREYRFIHRYWLSNMSDIVKHFSGFDEDVIFDFSFKYSQARLYSNTAPQFHKRALSQLPKGLKFWWNLRNDDIFNFRWGSADYVRAYINNLPPVDKSLGFHMGSDGYVWGREHTSTEPELPRQLEIDKHWYRFMLWGRLGYNPELSNDRFKKMIADKLETTHADLLYEIWDRASNIFPAVNRFHYHRWDWHWAVEYSASAHSPKSKERKVKFHDITEDNWKWMGWRPGGDAVAEELRQDANYVLENLNTLRGTGGKELRLTLGDLEAMAYAGLYYADKIMAGNYKVSNKPLAAEYLTKASGHWRRYAAVASSQYNPQLLARVGWMDWKELYPDVLRDIELMGGEILPPSLDSTPGGTLLEAEQAATKGGVTQSSIKGYTGTGYVQLGKADAALTFTYDAPVSGEYMLEFRYVLENGNSDMPILINGTSAGTINFWTTGSLSSWAWDRKTVRLNSGSNTITLESPGIGLKVDHVNVLRP
ncbi:CBM35 domain-containing protein [Planctomycetota bacterium]